MQENTSAKFNAIPEHIIFDLIERYYLTGRYSLVITLTDGTSICGNIHFQTKSCFSRKGYLELYYSVYIPLNQIAGICPLPYEQEVVKIGNVHYSDSAYGKLLDDLLKKARDKQFPIEPQFSPLSQNYIDMVQPFEWGDIQFSDDSLLYSDWRHLQFISAELNNLGIETAFSTFSVGLNKNFLNLFKEKIQLDYNSIEDSCAKQEVTLKGFISLITKRTYLPTLKKKREALELEMEGTKWIAAAICNNRARKLTDLKKNNWALAYFRSDSFIFPVELWEKISQPITVFGQIVPINTKTEAGKKSCFIKARAAAFLKNSISVTTSSKPFIKIRGDNDIISILFLAADPTDAARLRLGEESREIQEKLQLAKLRDRFLLHQRLSVRPEDLSQALLDLKPKIVHFSGHGTKTGALFFEDKLGTTHPIQPDALAALFEKFSDLIYCVILNSCYSETQAQAIAKHINYVIGMNQEIGDQAAIAFSIGFYQALGAGRSLPEAFELGCVQIGLQGISEHLTPVLIKKS